MFGWTRIKNSLLSKDTKNLSETPEKCPYSDIYHIISVWSKQLSKAEIQALIKILSDAVNRGAAGRILFEKIEADTVRVMKSSNAFNVNRADAIKKTPLLIVYLALINACSTRESISFLNAALDSKISVRSEHIIKESTETIEKQRWTPEYTVVDGSEIDFCGHKGATMTRFEITKFYHHFTSDPFIARSAFERLTSINQQLKLKPADETMLSAKKKEIERYSEKMTRVLHREEERVIEKYWEGDSGYW